MSIRRSSLAAFAVPVAALAAAFACAADDGAPPDPGVPAPWVLLPPPWSGAASLGYVRTSGNTETDSLSFKTNLDYKGVIWGNSFMASAYTGSRDKQTTDERYSVADKVNYNLTPKDYTFGNASYDNDRFSGIAERYALTVGYGRHIFDTPKQTFDLEFGVGANRSRNQDTNTFVEHAIATVGGKYVWRITAQTTFTQTLRTEFATNSTYVNPISELKLTVVGNLFATLDYEVRYNSSVPEGTKRVDQITTANLGYSFGIVKK